MLQYVTVKTTADIKGGAPSTVLLPLRVRASYNGQTEEMTATGRGQWTPVTWPYQSTLFDPTNYNRQYGYFYAAYQLILEFKDTSFVQGERQVLTNMSKLLDT